MLNTLIKNAELENKEIKNSIMNEIKFIMMNKYAEIRYSGFDIVKIKQEAVRTIKNDVKPLIDELYDNLYKTLVGQIDAAQAYINGNKYVNSEDMMLLLYKQKFKGKTLEKRFEINKKEALNKVLMDFMSLNFNIDDDKDIMNDLMDYERKMDISVNSVLYRYNLLEVHETVRSYNSVLVAYVMMEEDYAFEVVATVDDRTTEHCLDIDGKIILKEDLRESDIPPYHVNCRTVLEPRKLNKLFFEKWNI